MGINPEMGINSEQECSICVFGGLLKAFMKIMPHLIPELSCLLCISSYPL